MPDYQEIINDIEKAKRLSERANSMLNVALIRLQTLQSQADYEANQMGEAYKKGYIDAGIEGLTKGTLRSTIDDIDELTSGELKSTWKK